MKKAITLGVAIVCALAAGPAFAHHGPSVLGTVQIPEAFRAGDTPLQPGKYEIRLTGEHLPPLPGQSEEAEQVVEFVKDGMVVARDGASVMPIAAAPVGTSGRSRAVLKVERLKGDDFLRVSTSRGDKRFLIYLPIAK